jgi:hypothetical protein
MEVFVSAGVLHSHLLAPHGDGLGGDTAHGREGHLLPGKQCYFSYFNNNFGVVADNLTTDNLSAVFDIGLLSQMSYVITHKKITSQEKESFISLH